MDSNKLQLTFFIIIFAAAFIMCFLVFLPFIKVLALAAVLAVVFHPVFERVKKLLGGREVVSAIVIMMIAAIVVILPLIAIGSNVFDESRDLYRTLSAGETNYLDLIITNIEGPLSRNFPNLVVDIRSYVDDAISWIGSYAGALLTGTAITVLNLFLGIIAFFYFLKDGSKFRSMIIELSPLKDEFDRHIFDKLELSVNTVIKGTLLIALVQGLFVGVGLVIFGVPNATLWGMVAVVAAVVPGLGTALVILPACIYLLVTGATLPAVGLALWGAVLVGLLDNFLTPMLYSKGTNMHPLVVLFSVLGGIAFFGPIGFIFGPLVATLMFVLLRVYRVMILRVETMEEDMI